MGSKQEQLKSVLTDAIVELCRREAFYAEELRIEGTVCLVSDRSGPNKIHPQCLFEL